MRVFTLFCSSVYVFITALRFLVVAFLFPACYYSPCLNEGTCHEEGGGNYSCECRSGWTGKRCEVVIGRYFHKIIFMVVLLPQHPHSSLYLIIDSYRHRCLATGYRLKFSWIKKKGGHVTEFFSVSSPNPF